jgi:beta-phosphoglucomutase-like phosphatase (HAD superfamily)
MPGVSRLIEHLQGRLPLAVATNGPRSLASLALADVDLLQPFDVIVSAEEQALEKPAPDVYLAACGLLGVDPSDAVAFEDSAVGAASACAAGLTVVLAPSQPGIRASVDLRVPRVDDDRVFSLLGLHGGAPALRPVAPNRVTDDRP